MNKQKPIQNNPFRDFYDNSLPAEMKEGFISLVCQACDITYNHFYVWLRNPHMIKRPAQLIISNIAGRPVHELFLPKTKIEAWYFAQNHQKRNEIANNMLLNHGIDRDAFKRHLKGITLSPTFNKEMSEVSNISIDQLHEPEI